MKKISFLSTICLAGLGVAALLTSCDKTKPYDTVTAENRVHFVGTKVQVYQMLTNPAPVFKVTLGTTDVSSSDRTVTVKVTPKTSAVAGTHFNLVNGNTVTIPAGQATATFDVQGVQTYYTAGRKDTLMLTLNDEGLKPTNFNDTVLLVLRGPCFDDEIVFANLAGSYTKTYENGSYGPYTSTITNIVAVNATSSKATLTNIYDSGISAQATFDYSTVGSFRVTIDPQPTGFTVGGNPLFVRTTPSTTSSFTYCTPTFTIYLDLYTSAGPYDSWVMTMAR